jgi:hypothetical protein
MTYKLHLLTLVVIRLLLLACNTLAGIAPAPAAARRYSLARAYRHRHTHARPARIHGRSVLLEVAHRHQRV